MRILALVFFLLLVSSCDRRQGAPADWTYQDLAEHLSASGTGFKLVVEEGGSDLRYGYFVPGDFEGGAAEARVAFNGGATGIVRCVRMQSTDEARRQVRVVGYGGFASGRFAFSSRDDEALNRIRRTLP